MPRMTPTFTRTAFARISAFAFLLVPAIAGAQPAPAPVPPPAPMPAPVAPAAPVPPPAPAVAPAPAAPVTAVAPGAARADEAYRPAPQEVTGLDQVAELWGFTLVRTDTIVAGAADARGSTAVVDTIGIRYWRNHRWAVDAGVGVVVLAPDAEVPAWWGLAGLLGFPFAVAQWPHMTAYVKPQVSGYFMRLQERTHRFAVAGAALAGAELHLGWLHLPAVSLAAEGGFEVAFTGGRNPAPGGSFTGNYVRVVRPATLETLVSNIALRIYF